MVTRPREQARGLAARIEAEGGAALVYPAMEIDDVSDPAAERAIEQLQAYDLAIFVSPTAVQKALPLVRSRREWPAGLRAAAVGAASRRELERHGIKAVVSPEEGADSEALLALPELGNVSGKRVIIFRGVGGRELLGDTLAKRGAKVDYAACYRRSPPRGDFGPLAKAWAQGGVDALTCSSSAGLENLLRALGEPAGTWLSATPVFVPHERIAQAARRLGAREIRVCGPGDEQTVRELVAYFQAP